MLQTFNNTNSIYYQRVITPMTYNSITQALRGKGIGRLNISKISLLKKKVMKTII